MDAVTAHFNPLSFTGSSSTFPRASNGNALRGTSPRYVLVNKKTPFIKAIPGGSKMIVPVLSKTRRLQIIAYSTGSHGSQNQIDGGVSVALQEVPVPGGPGQFGGGQIDSKVSAVLQEITEAGGSGLVQDGRGGGDNRSWVPFGPVQFILIAAITLLFLACYGAKHPHGYLFTMETMYKEAFRKGIK